MYQLMNKHINQDGGTCLKLGMATGPIIAAQLKKVCNRKLHKKRGYPQYAWSLSSLKRRLAFFGRNYVKYDIEIEEVQNAVREEMDTEPCKQKLGSNINFLFSVIWSTILTMVDQSGYKTQRKCRYKKEKKSRSWNIHFISKPYFKLTIKG